MRSRAPSPLTRTRSHAHTRTLTPRARSHSRTRSHAHARRPAPDGSAAPAFPPRDGAPEERPRRPRRAYLQPPLRRPGRPRRAAGSAGWAAAVRRGRGLRAPRPRAPARRAPRPPRQPGKRAPVLQRLSVARVPRRRARAPREGWAARLRKGGSPGHRLPDAGDLQQAFGGEGGLRAHFPSFAKPCPVAVAVTQVGTSPRPLPNAGTRLVRGIRERAAWVKGPRRMCPPKGSHPTCTGPTAPTGASWGPGRPEHVLLSGVCRAWEGPRHLRTFTIHLSTYTPSAPVGW